MFLTEIYEAKQPKHVAFCFGRMNPPTIGHAKLMATTHKAARGGDYYIFLSHTQDKKDNPLDYNTKVQFVKRMFPKHAKHVSTGGLRTIIEIAGFLYDHGYTHVTFVAGSDRLEAFQKLLTSYNGVEGKKTYYKFANIDFVSSGDREDGAEGVEGVSASQARAAALANNMEAFAQATGAGKLAQSLFTAVRQGMGLMECAGTGVVRGGNDPRYKNALTVDVKPNTLGKEMKAFGLVGRKNPGAPTRQTPVSKNVGKGKKPV
jgi:hypothetical protein